MSADAKAGDLLTIDEILEDPAASFWLKAALRSALSRVRLMLPMMRMYWQDCWNPDVATS
jgi:hypothetical protein